MDLFDYQARKSADGSRPLAERMRPRYLKEFIGQGHMVGPGTLLRSAIENDRVFSMILWGPPGCGKTTLAMIISRETKSHYVHFSAVLSGVKQIRSVIDEAGEQLRLHRKRTILFVDEIHRFNKAQQDAFLHHVESGLITLIGATTENPSFEVNPALMSRCRVFTLKPLSDEDIDAILRQALEDKERGLGQRNLHFEPEALSHLVRLADGDGRTALNNLEAVASFCPRGMKRRRMQPGRSPLKRWKKRSRKRRFSMTRREKSITTSYRRFIKAFGTLIRTRPCTGFPECSWREKIRSILPEEWCDSPRRTSEMRTLAH